MHKETPDFLLCFLTLNKMNLIGKYAEMMYINFSTTDFFIHLKALENYNSCFVPYGVLIIPSIIFNITEICVLFIMRTHVLQNDLM